MQSGLEKVDTQEPSRLPCLRAGSDRSWEAAACCCWWGAILGLLRPKGLGFEAPLVCSLSTGPPPLLCHGAHGFRV